MNYISDKDLLGQRWKFYFVAAAWPVYLLLLPLVFYSSAPLGLVFMVFPGLYLFTWLGFLMHETWHKYVPNVPNDTLYTYFSWVMLTDPQIYRLLHGTHHAQVNTWEDREFHPLGRLQDPLARKIYNLLEITLGIAFVILVSSFMIPRNPQFKPKYKLSSLLTSVCMVAAFLCSVSAINYFIFNVPAHTIAAALIINFWLCSVILHHSQLIEHGNLIVSGEWNERILKVRNLSHTGLAEKVFLLLTHNDSREHVLHHTNVAVYSRPFPGTVPMPPDPVYITLKDYFKILRDMIKE